MSARAVIAVSVLLCAVVAAAAMLHWDRGTPVEVIDRAALSPSVTRSGTFRSGFLPLLRHAAVAAGSLADLGASRERNLFLIRERQQAMEQALADADAWLAAHPSATRDEPAVAAYREGEATIRDAMAEAQTGFLHLDFARVARATGTLEQGAAALGRAVALLDGQRPRS